MVELILALRPGLDQEACAEGAVIADERDALDGGIAIELLGGGEVGAVPLDAGPRQEVGVADLRHDDVESVLLVHPGRRDLPGGPRQALDHLDDLAVLRESDLGVGPVHPQTIGSLVDPDVGDAARLGDLGCYVELFDAVHHPASAEEARGDRDRGVGRRRRQPGRVRAEDPGPVGHDLLGHVQIDVRLADASREQDENERRVPENVLAHACDLSSR